MSVRTGYVRLTDTLRFWSYHTAGPILNKQVPSQVIETYCQSDKSQVADSTSRACSTWRTPGEILYLTVPQALAQSRIEVPALQTDLISPCMGIRQLADHAPHPASIDQHRAEDFSYPASSNRQPASGRRSLPTSIQRWSRSCTTEE